MRAVIASPGAPAPTTTTTSPKPPARSPCSPSQSARRRCNAKIRDRQLHPEDDHGIILLAEDNDINQLVAIETLAELGYRTDIARNGLEALQLVDTKPYLAILMDCQMPEMDGYTATAELRRREDTNHHIPIIAMTAGAFAEDRQRCLQAGMDDYLTKPIDSDELRTALDRWTSTPATEQR